ncbi:LemA family protein [Candidatus Uhrbacteria bacterium]|nr:LemA family protein [Candidatus Uhrbacteria bacterium]
MNLTTSLWILVAVAVVVVWIIVIFNSLVRRRNQTDEAWSDIDIQLRRRYDLIPNLVEAVKGYMAHERQTLEHITTARTIAMGAQSLPEKAQAENMLTDALKSLFAVAENYPDLKASQNFLQLQDEISDTENKIQAARRFYNANVRDFNTLLQSFPSNIVARMFAFTQRAFFEIDEPAARKPVAVTF